ncbi:peptide-methionine (S)-S-oxide reductase MsrA [Novosphingobium flavum]|uniref:Peptide methionine sulfoxide reductase MsrA n=1 Tax=Novosphingobium flavum TaxID=1778672 RepID=A0A7X1KKW7_9SPHN|nr:peptide-methionine (S)-S-oxide reductase MsrA [Novosphingobium flavum]MBC2664635.1 peptide-methionine (S)-S-oxide reductase MsrA [Novosphingobium flavum]
MGLKRALAGSLLLLAACQQPASAAPERAVLAPSAAVESRESGTRSTAIFSGGCFWGIEAVFSHLKGVRSAVSGYQGGSRATAQYETVGSGRTGHAESVRVIYDPSVIRYDQLLRVFFSVGADPTQLDRQGPDVGSQYRSALVPLGAEQNRVAEAYLKQLGAAHVWPGAIVTRIEPDKGFFPAEDYHQDFAANNPDHPYIRFWDAPKVAALKRMFPGLWKPAFTRG